MSDEKIPAKHEPIPTPAKYEGTPPPALKEQVEVPALLASAKVNVSHYLDYLENTNRTPDQVFEAITQTLQASNGKPETATEVPSPLQKLFPHFKQKRSFSFTPDSGLFSCACVLAHSQDKVDKETQELLFNQTKTWADKLHLEKHAYLNELLQKGLTNIEKPDQSTCFALRQMLMMILTTHPKVLEHVVSKQVAPLLIEDFLADLSKPQESFDINTLFVFLSAFGLQCPVYAEEEGELTAFYPSDSAGLKEVEGIVIWRGDNRFSVIE